MYRNQHLFVFIAISCTLMISGCNRAPETRFSLSSEVRELPELHQRQIEQTLFKMFGTPANPTIRMPSEPDSSSASDDEAESADNADSESGDGEEDGEEDADESELPPIPEFEYEVAVSEDVLSKLRSGSIVYRNRCSGCHGIQGDGHGETEPYLRPKPRDYRKGVFKFTSTPYGYKPARHDLVRTIRRGAKGTSMPAFPWMSEEDLDAVIEYVIYLSLRGEVEGNAALMAFEYFEDEVMEVVDFADGLESAQNAWANAETQVVSPITAEPPYDEESVKLGRAIFLKEGCAQCHGQDAKGQTEWLSREFLAAQEELPEEERVKINRDVWGEPAPAADLTSRMLHGGRRPIDIYRRVYTGIYGTPMPAFGDSFQTRGTPDHVWHLVHYVLHIIEGGDPEIAPAEMETDEMAADENAADHTMADSELVSMDAA